MSTAPGDPTSPTTDAVTRPFDSTTFKPPGEPPTLPPQMPGSRYRPLELHARGGLGEIYLAHDNECDRDVALKTVRYGLEDDAIKARFLREVAVTARLQHPGVVPVYGVTPAADGRPQYAMRFVTGETLHEATRRFHLADRGKREEGERSVALRQLLGHLLTVCNTVAYAHSKGVLHRDIKPENVMLGPFGETLLVDWGLAKIGPEEEATVTPKAIIDSGASQELTLAGQIMGTPAYMSPEQAAGKHAGMGQASDIYGLGATLYFVLTGEPPYRDSKLDLLLAKVQLGEFRPPRAVKKKTPAGLDAICRKAMALKPEDRYASAQELGQDISRWLADERVTAWREPWLERFQRLARKHAAFVAGLTLPLIVLAALSPQLINLMMPKGPVIDTSTMTQLTNAQSELVDLKKRQFEETEERHAMTIRLLTLYNAYFAAFNKLGRPPKNLDELKPVVKHPDDLLVPKSNKPFEIVWGLHPMGAGGKAELLLWEPVAHADGGRWALFTGLGLERIEYIGAHTFGSLMQAQSVAPKEEGKKGAAAPPPPPVKVIIDGKEVTPQFEKKKE